MNQAALQAFAKTFFEVVDHSPAEELRPYLTKEVRFQMGNLDASTGADNLIAAFESAQSRFQSIQHAIQGIWTGAWSGGAVVSVEAIAEYRLGTQQIVKLPVNSTLRLDRDGKVADYRIFIDPAPAFA